MKGDEDEDEQEDERHEEDGYGKENNGEVKNKLDRDKY